MLTKLIGKIKELFRESEYVTPAGFKTGMTAREFGKYLRGRMWAYGYFPPHLTAQEALEIWMLIKDGDPDELIG